MSTMGNVALGRPSDIRTSNIVSAQEQNRFFSKQAKSFANFFRYAGSRHTLKDCRNAAESGGLDLHSEHVEHKGAREYITIQISRLMAERKDDSGAFEYIDGWVTRKLEHARNEDEKFRWHFISAVILAQRAKWTLEPLKKEIYLHLAAVHDKAARVRDEAWKNELKAAALEMRPAERDKLLASAREDFLASQEELEALAAEGGMGARLKTRLANLAFFSGALAWLDPKRYAGLPLQSVAEQMEMLRKTGSV